MINLVFIDELHRKNFDLVHNNNLNSLNLFTIRQIEDIQDNEHYCVFIEFGLFFMRDPDNKQYIWIDSHKDTVNKVSTYNMPEKMWLDSARGRVHWIVCWDTESDLYERIDFKKLANGLNTDVRNITFLTACNFDETFKNQHQYRYGVNIIHYNTLFQWLGIDLKKQEHRQQIISQVSDTARSILNRTSRPFKGLIYVKQKRRHRLMILALLKHHGYLDDTIYSCGHNTQRGVNKILTKFPHLEKDLEYFINLQNRSPDDAEFVSNNAANINFDHARNSYLHLIAETFTTSRTYITEKSYKAILSMQPFVMLGNKGNVKALRDLGYDTLDKWINHSYDNIDDDADRMHAAFLEIQRLYKLTQDQWNDMLIEMLPALINNINILLTPKYHDIGELTSILLKHQNSEIKYINLSNTQHPKLLNSDTAGFISKIIDQAEHFNYEKYFVITPQTYSHNYNIPGQPIWTYIPPDVYYQVKQGKAKIIFDFSTEDIGFKTDKISRGSINPINTYQQLNNWAENHGIAEHCLFITIFEKTSSEYIQENSVKIVFLNSTVLRFSGFDYDSARKFAENPGENKTILWLNRRLRPHRLKSIDMAVEHGCDFQDMYFSLIGSKYETQTHDMTRYDDTKIISHNTKNSEYILKNLFNKEINLLSPEKNSNWLASGDQNRIYTMFDLRSKSVVEVVSEFTCYDYGHVISEKIIQPIISKKPFVLIGDREILKCLQHSGFRTFDEFWDESYDDMYYDDRMVAIAKLVANLQKTFDNYTLDQYNNVVYSDSMQEILEHNYHHYYNVYKKQIWNQWKSLF